MWPRARRFGNVYAFATVDALYTILWLSAWACLASYVAQGKSKGKSSDKSSSSSSKFRRASSSDSSSSTGSGCANWAYGSEGKCKLSEATTIIGVFILYVEFAARHHPHPGYDHANIHSILFAITAWISFRNVMHFRRTGTLPDAVSDPTFAAQTKAAFSSNPAHDFEDDEDDFRSGRGGGMAASSRGDRDEDYALLQQSEVDDLGHVHGRSAMHGSYDPTAPGPGGVLHDYNATGYGGAHGQHYGAPSEQYGAPSEYGSSMSGYGR